MPDPLKTYTSDVDYLLVEVCMAGAMYGLERQVGLIATHLVDLPRTQGPARLAHALAKTMVHDYRGAIALCDQVLQDVAWKRMHAEAHAFKQLACELQAGVDVKPLSSEVAAL